MTPNPGLTYSSFVYLPQKNPSSILIEPFNRYRTITAGVHASCHIICRTSLKVYNTDRHAAVRNDLTDFERVENLTTTVSVMGQLILFCIVLPNKTDLDLS